MKQKGNKNWTQNEIDIVDGNIGFLPLKEIVKILSKNGFSRTEMAIRVHCKTRNISIVCQYDNFSLRQIANILGITPAATFYWYKTEQLPAKRINEYQLMVKFEDVKKFLGSRTFKAKFNEDGLNFFLGN